MKKGKEKIQKNDNEERKREKSAEGEAERRKNDDEEREYIKKEKLKKTNLVLLEGHIVFQCRELFFPLVENLPKISSMQRKSSNAKVRGIVRINTAQQSEGN